MIGYVYHNGGANTANQDLGIKVAHSIGTFFGQLGFGFLADHLGRKKMYGIELMVIMIGTLGQAVAGRAPGVSIYGVLIMWRFIMVSLYDSPLVLALIARVSVSEETTPCPLSSPPNSPPGVSEAE
jgi:PHS family inorganic phosphate transporter-like MFS transporter